MMMMMMIFIEQKVLEQKSKSEIGAEAQGLIRGTSLRAHSFTNIQAYVQTRTYALHYTHTYKHTLLITCTGTRTRNNSWRIR